MNVRANKRNKERGEGLSHSCKKNTMATKWIAAFKYGLVPSVITVPVLFSSFLKEKGCLKGNFLVFKAKF